MKEGKPDGDKKEDEMVSIVMVWNMMQGEIIDTILKHLYPESENHIVSVHVGMRKYPGPVSDRKPFKLKQTLAAHISKPHTEEAMKEIIKFQSNVEFEHDCDLTKHLKTAHETIKEFLCGKMPSGTKTKQGSNSSEARL